MRRSVPTLRTSAAPIAVVVAAGLFAAVAPARAQQPAADTPLQAQYRAVADRIIDAALADSGAWVKLARITDTYGNRLAGSASLERALDDILRTMQSEGLENAHAEPVMVPQCLMD